MDYIRRHTLVHSAILMAVAQGVNALAEKPLVIDEAYFNYPYDRVYDYHIISAWKVLNEPVPAFTPQMIERHTELVGKLPWVNPTASGNENMIIGQTPGWPKDANFPNDPVIPPQNIYAYQITDPKAKGPKTKMIIATGSHSEEFTGAYVMEGMVNFLASTDPRAEFLRRKAVFYVYPSVNPDGKYMSVNRIELEAAPKPDRRRWGDAIRGNPHLYAAGVSDYNRVWGTKGKFPTIDIVSSAIIRDTGGSADYLWDLHGPQSIGNWRTPTDEARLNDYAQALIKREPEVIRCGPESGYKVNVGRRPATIPGKLSYWAAHSHDFKVKHAYVYEPGPWDRKRLHEAGRNLALALYDVLSNQDQ
jgi:hypothetical protein